MVDVGAGLELVTELVGSHGPLIPRHLPPKEGKGRTTFTSTHTFRDATTPRRVNRPSLEFESGVGKGLSVVQFLPS